MNYNDRILENKAFTIFKQAMYHIVVAVCIVLGTCLILVYGFGFRPYNVLTGSMAPTYPEHDLIVVKAQKEYKVGDPVTFNQESVFDKVTHRIVAIVNVNGADVYVCYGDAQHAFDPNLNGEVVPWETNVEYASKLTDEQKLALGGTQKVGLSQIEGKVVTSFHQWGLYITFIGDHKLLVIAMIIAIWCISATIQNELEMKKSLRLI